MAMVSQVVQRGAAAHYVVDVGSCRAGVACTTTVKATEKEEEASEEL